ncbi:hypothetical protein [Hymenobacter sp. UYP22]|uniref:hypothetical protein n=1 Tax=Hymenobacter sp. UYP22 TaxID=3156348 RepID=UPI0033924B30
MQTEASIKQRLKVLIDSLGMNATSFSNMVGVHDGTTRTYLDRASEPSAAYIASIIGAVERINPTWLLLGWGAMFLDGAAEVQLVDAKRPEAGEPVVFEKEALRKEVEMLWTLIGSRDALIESKDVVIAAKDDLIAAKEEVLTLLRGGHNRPN